MLDQITTSYYIYLATHFFLLASQASHTPSQCCLRGIQPGRGEGGGAVVGWGLTYERGWDAYQRVCIKPLKQADLGVAQAFLTPKKTMLKY